MNGREDGAAGLVTLFAVLLLVVVAVAGIAAAADLSVTAARARAAADAAALAGASVSPLVAPGRDEPATAAARRVALANRARLAADDSSGWPLRYRVTVEVDAATAWVRHMVGPVRAEAVAAVRPRLSSETRGFEDQTAALRAPRADR